MMLDDQGHDVPATGKPRSRDVYEPRTASGRARYQRAAESGSGTPLGSSNLPVVLNAEEVSESTPAPAQVEREGTMGVDITEQTPIPPPEDGPEASRVIVETDIVAPEGYVAASGFSGRDVSSEGYTDPSALSTPDQPAQDAGAQAREVLSDEEWAARMEPVREWLMQVEQAEAPLWKKTKGNGGPLRWAFDGWASGAANRALYFEHRGHGRLLVDTAQRHSAEGRSFAFDRITNRIFLSRSRSLLG